MGIDPGTPPNPHSGQNRTSGPSENAGGWGRRPHATRDSVRAGSEVFSPHFRPQIDRGGGGGGRSTHFLFYRLARQSGIQILEGYCLYSMMSLHRNATHKWQALLPDLIILLISRFSSFFAYIQQSQSFPSLWHMKPIGALRHSPRRSDARRGPYRRFIVQ
jgi:hypothetical protein